MSPPSTEPSVYRYPFGNLLPDYLRAALGTALLAVPFFYSFGGHWMVTIGVGALFFLFVSFGVTTAIRQFSALWSDQHGLRVEGPRPKAIPWDAVSSIDLRYFSTRREKDKGWFELKVKGNGTQIKADSNLNDLYGLLSEVATAVTRHGLSLTPIARENFQAAGFTLPEPGEQNGERDRGSP
ncbi:MAG TPA: hypothetical protein VKA18_04670 [Alphaproteobacteria bacterium]|nr:hypothetical protein [Alphaproteobacteria bacterium]